jgi:hypothetical protein
MRRWQRLAMYALAPLCATVASTTARAQAPGTAGAEERVDDPKLERRLEEGIDDPKLERRLGTRVDLPPATLAVSGPTAAPTAEAVPSTAEVGAAPVAELGRADALDATQGAALPDEQEAPRPPGKPRVKLGYRRFSFAQVPPTGMTGPGAAEPFDVLSVDFYPVSSTFRFGLSTQYGWEEGTFRQNGDAFFAQSLSFGVQVPGPAFTPFVEGYAGGGLLQRTKSGLGLNSIATAYGQLGLDVGTEVFLARYFYLSFALGYVHLGDVYARKTVESFSVDTWSFKVGVGL